MNTPNPETLRMEYFFAAPPERIWQAWTDPDVVRKWFGSDPDGVVLYANLHAAVGGTFEVCFMNADQTQFTCFGKYTHVLPNRELAFTWSWKDRPDSVELISLKLTPKANGTVMRFEISDIDPHSFHNYEAGWASTFQKLETALNGSRS